MNNTQNRDGADYIYASTVKSRYGLNDAWIKRLGPPDKQVVNLHYPSGPPASLYRVARVEEFLDANGAEFASYLVRRSIRSAAMTAVAESKRREMLDWAESVEIQHFPWPDDLCGACERHLEALWRCGMASGVPDVTPRRILNMLRHAFTNYEHLLAQTDGKVGAGEAYGIIKRRINDEIVARLLARGICVESEADRVTT